MAILGSDIADIAAEKAGIIKENGGTLITTFMSGIVDQSDNVHLGGYPGPLRESAGCNQPESST